MDLRGVGRPLLRRPRGLVDYAVIIGASIFLLIALAGAALRHYRAGGPFALGLVSASPYLLLGAPLALVLLLVGRQWLIAIGAGIVLITVLTPYLPLYVSASPPPDGRRLVVMTANLRLGLADADRVVAEVRQHDVEVLMLQELTGDEQERLNRAGLEAALPYHESVPRDGGGGTGLWSRYPLRDVQLPRDYSFAMVVARVAVPGLPVAPTAVALHLAGPVPNAGAWQRDIRRLPSTLQALPDDAPVVVGGDFNATTDAVQFRRLLTGGYRDGADQAGAGITRSFPSNRWYPPLIAIDHVVTRDAVATDVETLEIPGSDHRALLARVALPR
jgi:endonuclease/exonuclease/phosphatase (EEP) superfamily protein YafD